MSDLSSPTINGLGTVRALTDHDLDPLFWRPDLLHSHSAWCGHIPFAHWVVRAVSPRILVELGTHTGVSYSAFCLAVEREKLDTKCFAVDTWEGDGQAGYYGDDVYSTLAEHHKEKFSAFSTLVRRRFDDALEVFSDNSVDLLHIDGLHTYEAVAHDFQTWRCKLSDRAIVLFHDTNVLRDDFGVWRFWAEIRRNYLSFEFVHGNGLGVLAVGDNAPQAIVELCRLADPAVLATARDRFAFIGERWEVEQSAKWQAEQQALNNYKVLEESRGAASIAQQERAEALAAKEAANRLQIEAMADSSSLFEEAKTEAAMAQKAARTSACLLEEVKRELEQVNEEAKEELEQAEAKVLREADARRLIALELAQAEQETKRLQREIDVLREWAAAEHLLLRRDVAVANDAATKARELGHRHARARFLAETRLRIVQQRKDALECTPGGSLAAGILRFDRQVPVAARALQFAYRLGTFQLGQRRLEQAQRQAQLQTEAEKNAIEAKAVADTDLFDAQYYLDRYPDVTETGMIPEMHFAVLGWHEGRRPSEGFDPDFYMSEYSDVAEAGLNPLLHYHEHGRREGRLPLPPSPALRELSLPHPSTETKLPPQTIRGLVEEHFAICRPLPVFYDDSTTKSLTILTDSLGPQSLFGGVGTALVIGTLMARRLKCRLRIATRHDAPDAGAYSNILSANSIATADNPEFVYVPLDGSRPLLTGPSDLVLTTSWWTTRSAMQSLPSSSIIYLLQEDERMFYPSGDNLLRCVETLNDESINIIVNTKALFDHLAEGASPLRGLQQRGSWFKPAFPSIKKPKWKAASSPQNFFFYARPNHARNLFWRGLEAIESSIEEGVLDTFNWRFFFVGSDVPPLQLPGGIEPEVVSHMPWADYASFVSTIDLGLSLMDTPHPSYPPIDLAAAGAVVVTSAHGCKVSLGEWSSNIICTEPTVAGLREGLKNGVMLANDMVTRRANYEKNTIDTDWHKALEPSFLHILADSI